MINIEDREKNCRIQIQAILKLIEFPEIPQTLNGQYVNISLFNECYKIMKKGGILIWGDQVLPQYKKVEFDIIGRIGMVKSTNHRFRVITIFKKK